MDNIFLLYVRLRTDAFLVKIQNFKVPVIVNIYNLNNHSNNSILTINIPRNMCSFSGTHFYFFLTRFAFFFFAPNSKALPGSDSKSTLFSK